MIIGFNSANLLQSRHRLNYLTNNMTHSIQAQLVKLENWQAISVSGDDTNKYLNSQVTCDLASLADTQASFGCHCDAKGKLWSQFYLIPTNGDTLLFQHKTTLAKSATELSKFGVFSKVNIKAESENYEFYAVIGDISNLVETELNQTKALETGFLCKLSDGLQLYVKSKAEQIEPILANLNSADESLFTQQLSLKVLPFITEQHISEFVPQMLNSHAIGGISFKKGCYMGQETVARMRYLGKNKRACFAFTAEASSQIEIGNTIEVGTDSSWRRVGQIIQVTTHDNSAAGLAVFASDIEIEAKYRVKESPDTCVIIQALPYSLDY